MTHFTSVFNNSCVKVPVDPKTKMPATDYERKAKNLQQRVKNKRRSIDSISTDYSLSKVDIDAKQVREFYESIPDYNDINHLPQEEFYSTLRLLREKKSKMLGHAISHLDDVNGDQTENNNFEENEEYSVLKKSVKELKSKPNLSLKTTYEKGSNSIPEDYSSNIKKITDDIDLILSDEKSTTAPKLKSNIGSENELKHNGQRVTSPIHVVNVEHTKEQNIRLESRSKRIYSACSKISWNDQCHKHDDIDNRFDKYFNTPYNKIGNDRKSRSMPSSPIKVRRTLSPDVYRKNCRTVPKPFKMTLRDEDDRISNNLKYLSKSFSEEMLDRKVEKKRFRARPVPIESRIPLYDKILEDQAMRRAISKINSSAELQAQMKPFSFTEREELRPKHTCDRHDPADDAESGAALPRTSPVAFTATKSKKFRARPIPKNLFSNFIYEKMRDDEFYRALNRRIRAEELLRKASLPPSMAARDKPSSRSRMSTPGGLLSDLPTDTTSDLSSNKPANGKRNRKKRNSTKGNQPADVKQQRQEFITTSPQPFRFNTAHRASRKESLRKIYSPTRLSPSRSTSGTTQARPLSALDVPSVNRSNLAAVLRIETTKKKLEDDISRRLADQELKAEMKWRDHILRKKPAWQLVKNNHEEDIAIRLQTRRDEERMRREEFLHEMELMYGRVQKQPLLFERYYTPPKTRRDFLEHISQELAPPHTQLLKSSQKRRSSKRASRSAPPHLAASPQDCSRKVSINETTERVNSDFIDYLDRMSNREKLFSETSSFCEGNSTNVD